MLNRPTFRMKYFFFLAGLFLMLTAQQCKTKSAQTSKLTESSSPLYKTWLHSYEDETEEGIRVYRPNSFDFPPSRGRTGFTIEPGGKFVQYTIAPTDGLVNIIGLWTMKDKNTLSLSFADGKQQPYDIEIVSLEPEMLKLKMIFEKEN